MCQRHRPARPSPRDAGKHPRLCASRIRKASSPCMHESQAVMLLPDRSAGDLPSTAHGCRCTHRSGGPGGPCSKARTGVQKRPGQAFARPTCVPLRGAHGRSRASANFFRFCVTPPLEPPEKGSTSCRKGAKRVRVPPDYPPRSREKCVVEAETFSRSASNGGQKCGRVRGTRGHVPHQAGSSDEPMWPKVVTLSEPAGGSGGATRDAPWRRPRAPAGPSGPGPHRYTRGRGSGPRRIRRSP